MLAQYGAHFACAVRSDACSAHLAPPFYLTLAGFLRPLLALCGPLRCSLTGFLRPLLPHFGGFRARYTPTILTFRALTAHTDFGFTAFDDSFYHLMLQRPTTRPVRCGPYGAYSSNTLPTLFPAYYSSPARPKISPASSLSILSARSSASSVSTAITQAIRLATVRLRQPAWPDSVRRGSFS